MLTQIPKKLTQTLRVAKKKIIFLGFIAIAFTSQIQSAKAVGTDGAELPQVNFLADEMDFDKNLGIVTARGGVEVTHRERTLFADIISYNQKTDILTATGNITLLEPSGDVIFAEHLELTGDFKNGVVSNIRIILSDSSRIAANGARRINGNLDMRKGVYSPCKPCEEDPSRAPLWQIKAVKIYHDTTQKSIEYTDAWLEVAGIPVLYTPYLTHPDSTVKRKSGFLTPSFGNKTNLGFTVKTPYFWDISKQTDATITPTLYMNQGAGLITEVRHFLNDGELQLDSSIAVGDTEGTDGHIGAVGNFNIDRTWRWGFDANYTSDDTYLRRYGFNSPQTLESNLYAEGFRKRNYLRADTYFFQGLEASDTLETTPLVAPLISFQHKGTPNSYGGMTTLDASFVSLTREQGVDSTRLSIRPGWETNYVSSLGEAYKLSLSLDTDLYYINDYTTTNRKSFSGFTGRIFPQAKLDWRLPMVKQTGSVHQLLEPVAALVIAPNNVNRDNIANQDSLEFEFDETSLFRRNRFAGEDRSEGGTRIDYGLNWGVFGESGGKTTAFVGQSYRLHRDGTFAEETGLEDNLSDIVGKLQISPNSYLNVLYRTRISKSNGDIRRNELSIQAGAPLFRVSAQYQFFPRLEDSEFFGREDVNVTISSQFNRLWRGQASIRHDIADEQTRSFDSSLIYEDECFALSANFTRTFFQDRELRPADTIMFQLSFKTLGEFQTN